MRLWQVLDSADVFIQSETFTNVKLLVIGIFLIIMVGYIVAKLIWRKK